MLALPALESPAKPSFDFEPVWLAVFVFDICDDDGEAQKRVDLLMPSPASVAILFSGLRLSDAEASRQAPVEVIAQKKMWKIFSC